MRITRNYRNEDAEAREHIDTYLGQNYEMETVSHLAESYETFRKTQQEDSYRNNPAVKQGIDNAIKGLSWDLFLHFIIGIKEVTTYLAFSILNGYGGIADKFLAGLTMAIGAKLGDPEAINCLQQRSVPRAEQKLADKCLPIILKNMRDVEGREITWEEIMARAIIFDQLVQSSGHSYCEAIETYGAGMKTWARYIEVTIDPSDSIDPIDLSGAVSKSNDCCVLL